MKIKSQFNLFIDLIMFVILIPIFISRGNIHEVFGYLFGLLTLIHLVLHWKHIYGLIKVRFPVPKIRQFAVSVICIICIVTTFWSIGQSGKNHRERGLNNRVNSGFEKGNN